MNSSKTDKTARGGAKSRIALASIAATAAGALLIPGCSGSSASNHAVVRVTNAIAQAGVLSMIINSGSVNGTQKYGETSGYLYFPKDGTSTAAFALDHYSTNTYPLDGGSVTFDVTGSNAYTLIAYGDPTAPEKSIETPNVLILTDNNNSIPSSTALVRIANVAPAAGTIDYSLNGGTATPVAYGATTSSGDPNGYLSVPSGSLALQVNSATTGAALYPAQTLPISAGHAYTILISEPTIAVTTTTTVGTTTTTTTTGTTTYGSIVLSDR